MTKILGSLPSKFRNFRQAWLSLDEAIQTIPNLTARLLDEEATLTSNEETENALAASSKVNKTFTQHKQKENFQKGKNKVTCYNCQKKGYFAKDCWGPKKDRDKGKKSSEEGNFSAFNVEECDTSSLFQVSNEKWIWDSGASDHMTHRREFFTDFIEGDTNATVLLGNNQGLTVKGQGTVKIKKLINEKWFDAVITEVLYVPDLKKNLFSEGTITRKGMKIIKESNYAKIYDNEKIVATAIRESNNLYQMQFQTVITHQVW